MTHPERVHASLRGQGVDRPPVSLWRHFFVEESSAAGLAQAMLAFQDRFHWDFMKVNPRAAYHAQPWGYQIAYSGQPTVGPRMVDYPVKSADDWGRIQELPPTQGAPGEMLTALRLIREGLRGEVPFVMTVFTPLSVAAYLAGSNESMVRHLREHPQQVHSALGAIAATFARFGQECLAAGASGIFLATTHWATYDLATDAEYAEFGRPYDLQVLQAVSDAPFNVLHVCKENNMLRRLADYPATAFNWNARHPSNPTLREGRSLTGKAVIGGIAERTTLLQGPPEAIAAEARDAREQTGGRGFMLGAGCTFLPETPEAHLWAARQALLSQG
ncbi:MAG: uroporphyrinogen decarboxylase [Chloroflexi bacterium]|nr:uroporphyrinogen decarboxylase [Chloroflexota bacterium]